MKGAIIGKVNEKSGAWGFVVKALTALENAP